MLEQNDNLYGQILDKEWIEVDSYDEWDKYIDEHPQLLKIIDPHEELEFEPTFSDYIAVNENGEVVAHCHMGCFSQQFYILK